MAEATVNSSANNDQKAIQPAMEPWMTKTLIIGAGVGAATGLLGAYLLVRNSQNSGLKPTVSPREFVKIALLLLGTIRSVANLWE